MIDLYIPIRSAGVRQPSCPSQTLPHFSLSGYISMDDYSFLFVSAETSLSILYPPNLFKSPNRPCALHYNLSPHCYKPTSLLLVPCLSKCLTARGTVCGSLHFIGSLLFPTIEQVPCTKFYIGRWVDCLTFCGPNGLSYAGLFYRLNYWFHCAKSSSHHTLLGQVYLILLSFRSLLSYRPQPRLIWLMTLTMTLAELTTLVGTNLIRRGAPE